MAEIFTDALVDSLKLLPFLLITYLLIEYMERRAGGALERFMRKSGRAGPAAGALAGVVPQCGLSCAASGFYARGALTAGTLLAVFLASSDEMLPILISSGAPALTIIKILLFKVIYGAAAGFAADAALRRRASAAPAEDTPAEDGSARAIIISALLHTAKIFAFIFLVTLGISAAVSLLGMDRLRASALGLPVVGQLICGLLGLIPNCASSVLITDLYLESLISPGAMMAGLLANSGMGLLVLWRAAGIKRGLRLTAVLLGAALAAGLALDAVGAVF